ncbi:MAG TPA: Holliday junction branch migration protein RuvA [Longimicrobiales bacterium]|nr:Holliday junction branch migration protein RuvA [Longimicrobiales bacterium]
MIRRLRGTLVTRKLGVIEIMTVAGVGYEVEIPLTVYERLPREGDEVEIRTHQVFREDGVTLYGFIEEHDRAVFARMLTASGVGPRLALNMLSTMPTERLVRAILAKDLATLRQIPGLGAKKAEKLAVEMADRLDDLAVGPAAGRPRSRGADEAISALAALGYSTTDAATAVRQILDGDQSIDGPQQLIRLALAALSSR